MTHSPLPWKPYKSKEIDTWRISPHGGGHTVAKGLTCQNAVFICEAIALLQVVMDATVPDDDWVQLPRTWVAKLHRLWKLESP